MTRPAAMAACRTWSLSTVSFRTRRTAPPATWEMVTPGNPRAQFGVAVALHPHHQTARPLLTKSSTVPETTRARGR